TGNDDGRNRHRTLDAGRVADVVVEHRPAVGRQQTGPLDGVEFGPGPEIQFAVRADGRSRVAVVPGQGQQGPKLHPRRVDRVEVAVRRTEVNHAVCRN